MTTNWPALPIAAWEPTRHTLHMYTQVVGKVKLALTPTVNHWWNSALYISARGLTTGALHCPGGRLLEVEFDFIDHLLRFRTDDEPVAELPLRDGYSVAEFYSDALRTLRRELGVPVRIWPTPVEVPEPIPFTEDETHASYDPEFAHRHWRALAAMEDVLLDFRAEFLGKSSPVHFFWGSFDLAVTRFSGRPAPEREGADAITREAYSHEVISHGFWPGGAGQDAAFYAYAAPEPEGFADAAVQPEAAYYDRDGLKIYVLPYEAVRSADDPEAELRAFLHSTYDAGARLGAWDSALVRPRGAAQV